MFLQSVTVYLILIGLMIIFGSIASYRFITSVNNNGLTSSSSTSFWRVETLLPLILFAIVMGMRYDVGADHLNYLAGYLSQSYVGKEEYIFFLFSDIGWYFNLHYTVYFGLIAFLQILFFFLAFKDRRFLYPSLVFFLFVNGSYIFWMNGIRQALAMCVWIYSLKFIENRRLIKYLALGLVAFFIHRSSIILLIFYPLLRSGKDYFRSIPLQLILLAGAFIIRDVFFSVILRFESIFTFYTSLLGADLYESYSLDNLVESISSNDGTGIAYIFKIAMNVLVIVYSQRLKSFYNNKWFIIIYFFFFLGVLATYIFPDGVISLSRPFRYFYIFQSIMYSYLLYYFYKNRNIKLNFLFMWLIIISFLGMFILHQYNAGPHSHTLYQFYFEYPNINGYPK